MISSVTSHVVIISSVNKSVSAEMRAESSRRDERNDQIRGEVKGTDREVGGESRDKSIADLAESSDSKDY
jgi:hypothetical protein